MFTTHKTSEKLLKHLWTLREMLPMQQLHWSSFQSPKPLSPPLRPPKSLVRLVIKARGWRWPRARRLPRVELGQRLGTKGLVTAKRSPKLNLCRRPRAQRLTKARRLFPRQRSSSQSSLKLLSRKRRPPRARLLILLSFNQPTKKILLQPRLSQDLSFLLMYFSFVVAVCHNLRCTFPFLLMKRC